MENLRENMFTNSKSK